MMQIDEFIELLKKAGWNAVGDAQHDHIRYIYNTHFAALEKRCEELLQKVQELDRERDELKWALSAHLGVALDDPILENNLQKMAFRLEEENARLKEEIKGMEFLTDKALNPGRYG